MKISASILSAAMVLGVSFAGQAAPIVSQCTAHEKVIFSCATGPKIVSICASQSFPGPASSLQYRFGPKGAPELALPKDGASRAGVSAGSIAYSRGGGAYLSFANSGTRYVVYSVVMNGGADQAQGLVVQKGEKVLANLTCKKGSLTDNLQPDFSGVPQDTAGFEVP